MTPVMQCARAAMGVLAAGMIIGALGGAPAANAETTISCPSGTYDMLDWMTMDSDLRSTYHMEGTSNPLYTVMESGKFVSQVVDSRLGSLQQT